MQQRAENTFGKSNLTTTERQALILCDILKEEAKELREALRHFDTMVFEELRGNLKKNIGSLSALKQQMPALNEGELQAVDLVMKASESFNSLDTTTTPKIADFLGMLEALRDSILYA